MDKLIAMKIKYDDGTYSDEIPISVLAENVQWDSSHTLVDVLGNVNLTSGSIQDQITYLFNNKISNADMQAYVNNSMPTIITNWLDTNVTPVGSAVVIDESLTIEGAAADAKITGDNIEYVFKNHINRPICFNKTGKLFNGSNSPTSDLNAQNGYSFQGFDRITNSGSATTFGVIKQIIEEDRIDVLTTVGDIITISIYLKLYNKESTVKLNHLLLGTGSSWNRYTESFIDSDNIILTYGWNNITLKVKATSSSSLKYSYCILASNDLTEIQKIQQAYIFLNSDVTRTIDSINAISATYAGCCPLDSEALLDIGITKSGTVTQDNTSWSVDGYNHILNYGNVVATGNYYGRIAWNIKELFGKGIKLNIRITNENGNTSGWYWNSWHLSKVSTSWGINQILGLTNFIGSKTDLSATKSQFEIDIDSDFSSIDPDQYNYIWFLVAAYQVNPNNKPQNTLSIQITALTQEGYVYADGLKDFNKNNYYTKTEINELVNDPSFSCFFAKNAGGYYLDNKIIPNIGITKNGIPEVDNMNWSSNGYTHILQCGEVVATGHYYGRIAWNIKELFGKNIKLKVHITNEREDTNGWYWSDWCLSKSSQAWGSYMITNFTSNIRNIGDLSAKDSLFEIDIDTFFSSIDPSDYNNIYFLVASYKGNPNHPLENVLSIEITALTQDGYVYADELKDFNKNDYYTKAEINELIETNDTNLLFWGDSLTAGAGGSGTSYPAICAAELGNLSYRNCGVGGENANTIAARQGGNTLIIPAGPINGTYAYTEFKDVFGGNVRPLRQGNGTISGGNVIYINGIECNLSITQTSSTSTDAVYTISGYTGESSLIPLPAKFKGSQFTADIVVIWVGQNGSYVNGQTDYNAKIAIINSMISHLKHNQYVVLGYSSGTETQRAEDDKALFKEYGNKFFPTRKMVSQYGMTLLGLTPTSQDQSQIAAGQIPASLRNDGIHLNANGYTALGKLLAQHIRALGYI